MGPRSDERGNGYVSETTGVAITLASMGPRTRSLQWGRAPMSAEIRTNPGRAKDKEGLQWGRAPMSAEIGPEPRAMC